MSRVLWTIGRSAVVAFVVCVLQGCCYTTSRTDLTGTPEVQRTGLIGKTLVLEDDELLLRQRWANFDDLCGDSSPKYLNHWHEYLSGKLPAGTTVVVRRAERDCVLEYILTFSEEVTLAQVLGGPNSGGMINIGPPDELAERGLDPTFLAVQQGPPPSSKSVPPPPR